MTDPNKNAKTSGPVFRKITGSALWFYSLGFGAIYLATPSPQGEKVSAQLTDEGFVLKPTLTLRALSIALSYPDLFRACQTRC